MSKSLDMVAEMKAAAEVEVQKMVDLATAIVDDERAAADAAFDEGVKSAGNVNAGDKLYSEEELQAELAPYKEKIASLEAKIAAIGDVDAKIAAALAEQKAVLAAKLEAADADNQAILAELKG